MVIPDSRELSIMPIDLWPSFTAPHAILRLFYSYDENPLLTGDQAFHRFVNISSSGTKYPTFKILQFTFAGSFQSILDYMLQGSIRSRSRLSEAPCQPLKPACASVMPHRGHRDLLFYLGLVISRSQRKSRGK